MRYENLDLPCLKRSYICTHFQFVKEYKLFYPELNYEIPSEIVERFDTANNASNNCIIIFETPPVSVNEAVWLCHENLETLFSFQAELSKRIEDANSNKYTFIADYIENRNRRVSGILSLENNKIEFREIANSASNFVMNYDDISPYVISLYLREKLLWEGNYEKPEESRCLKIQRKGQSYVNNPDYFCIYYSRNDFSMMQPLNVVQARYEAEMYANKINIRLQKINLSKSIEILSNKSNSSDIDGNVLAPIKIEIRTEIFKFRHKLLSMVKLGKISMDIADTEIENSKEKIINSVCLSLENCTQAIKYSIEKGLLPLDGYRDKFAFDLQNPFNNMMPKMNVKIDIKSDNIAKNLMQEVTSMINADRKSSNDIIPDSAPGEIPNANAIKKALNTIQTLRDTNRVYNKIEEIGQNCRINVRKNTNSLKRKVAILSYLGDHDIFFNNLGKMRNFINRRKK